MGEQEACAGWAGECQWHVPFDLNFVWALTTTTIISKSHHCTTITCTCVLLNSDLSFKDKIIINIKYTEEEPLLSLL